MAEYESWWRRIQSSLGGEGSRQRWPAGLASHPRVLAIFREYYLACVGMNVRNDVSAPAPIPYDDESAWGVEDAESEAGRSGEQVHPVDLLIFDLEFKVAHLYKLMSQLVMLPVGVDAEVRLGQSVTDLRPFVGPTQHDVHVGVKRLLAAPNDVRNPRDNIEGEPQAPSSAHRQLFAAYRAHLNEVLAGAEEWWAGIISMHEDDGLPRDRALEAAYEQVPAGPVADPYVIGVIRAYWQACETINAELPLAARVAPERLLLAWLQDGHHDSWVRVLTAMPYWPIGLDEQGRWV